jgi:hypothetical protein
MTVAGATVIAACPDGNDWRLLPSGLRRRTEKTLTDAVHDSRSSARASAIVIRLLAGKCHGGMCRMCTFIATAS